MYLFYPAYPQKAISTSLSKMMLHPLFPALTACFPASVRVALAMDQISITVYTSTISTYRFFEYRISERSILFFLYGI